MSKIVIKQKDLIGELRRISNCIVKMMLEEQVKQGNKLDITIFQNKIVVSGRGQGGFNWDETEEGFDFWDEELTGNKKVLLKKK